MRFGCCGSMIAPTADPLGIEIADSLAELGFDYIELSARDLAGLTEKALADTSRRLKRAGVKCEACNNFFPPSVRLTGKDADMKKALAHATVVMERIAQLGAEVLVFGSSGAKNVPAGFPVEKAWKQIAELLEHLGPLAEQYGITIVIEPLSKRESNIVNLAAEGLRLVREVDHPCIQLLVDYYHMTLEKEDPRIVLEAGPALRHLHLAAVDGRTFPIQPDDSLLPFFAALRQISYSGRCSVEAYTKDFPADAHRSIQVLRELTKRK